MGRCTVSVRRIVREAHTEDSKGPEHSGNTQMDDIWFGV